MITENNILKADEGKLIMHINKLCACKEISLGKEANPKEWIEIGEDKWDFEKDCYKEISETENNLENNL